MPITLAQLTSAIKELPEPPQSRFLVLSMLEDPKYSLDQVANTIAQDETLSLKILKLANSAQFSRNTKILTIKDALVLIGTRSIKVILYQDMLETSKMAITPFFIELWKSALFTALLTKSAAVMLRHNRPELCFTAGMICDVGLLMINQFSGNLCSGLIKKVQTDGLSLPATEDKIFGFNHQHVGVAVAQHWNLSNLHQNIIKYHHDPLNCPHQMMESDYAVMVAVHVANNLSPVHGPDGWKYIRRSAISAVNNCPYTYEEIVGTLQHSFESINARVSQYAEMMFGAPAEEDGEAEEPEDGGENRGEETEDSNEEAPPQAEADA